MLIIINPDNPESRKIKQIVDCLEGGGVIIFPTDTVYGIGCDISNHKAVERVCRIRGLNPAKVQLSFICKDISQAATYAHQIDNDVFRVMRRHLPGPFTFILKSSHLVPKIFKNKKNTVGIRIPANNIAVSLVRELGRPILSASLKREDEIQPYFADPEDMHEAYEKLVDIVIDGGFSNMQPSTLVDCTTSPPELLRQGAGVLETF
jgi:tRNA threonylcarbamoyl adenosine modification protein (Sua5/YciO/YrdC/YwlC family)